MKKICVLLLCLSMFMNGSAQENASKMAWWQEAKFGLFVHWGPYCLYGGVYNGFQQRRGGAEWIMNRCKIPVGEYRAKASTFNPTKFNADSLVLMAKKAGMKYVVFTTKHHDGFAMFQSDASKFNIVDYTPFKRDIVDEVVKACRRYGLRVGFYYSQSQDWCNAGGATARKEMKEGWPNRDSLEIDAFTKAHRGAWDYNQFSCSFDEYFHRVSLPQMKELLSRYPDVATIFFDTPMSITDKQAGEMQELLKDYPQIIVNDRLKRPNFPGDYKTPEGRVPKREDVVGVYWETCMNIGSSWGYKSWDTQWKSSDEIIKTLIQIASRGGNLLLNVGPDSFGLVPAEARKSLDGVGAWLDKYGEVIYGTQRCDVVVPWGECVRRDEKKKSYIYLCVFDKQNDGRLVLDANVSVRRAQLLNDAFSKVNFSRQKGQITVTYNPEDVKESVPIIKLELTKPLPPVKLVSNTQKYFDIVDTD